MYNENVINEIKEYFKENKEVFNDCIEELDNYNSYLGDDRYYFMEELDEMYCNTEITEVLTRAFYGYDEDNYYTDKDGQKIYSSFNPNRIYFYFNGYGNLVSSDYKDYMAFLDEDFIIQLYENRQNVYAINYKEPLIDLFNKIEMEG